jgi:hypothetical protein
MTSLEIPVHPVLDSEHSVSLTPPHASSETKIEVRVIKAANEIEPIRKTWADWCENPDADPDFFLLAPESKSELLRPHVIVVFREGQPDCILVGRLEKGKKRIKIGYSTVFRPYVRTLVFLSGGYLGNQTAENSELIVSEILKSLRNGEADCAELRQLPLDSTLSFAARTQPGFVCRQHHNAEHIHRCLELPATFQDYLESLPRKHRHETRRHMRRLQKDYPNSMQIQCYRHDQDVDQLRRDVEKIHAKSYQNAVGVGFVDSEGIRARIRAMAKKDDLRGCVLYVSGEPAAFFIGYKYKRTLYGQYLGFDPQFQRYSPGLQILMHAIEDCCEPDAGLAVLDLGWGERNYKRQLCNQSWMESPVYITAPTLKGMLLNAERSLTAWLDAKLKNWLSSTGFDKHVRKIWQKFAVRKSKTQD